MAHDVFISYAADDKPTADAVCATLEGSRIPCWVAPRDVLPGQDYSETLVEAIGQSRLMVLVFSSSSNNSPHVMREVERAVSKGIPILPLRTEDVPPSPSMEYFISSTHWLDALTPPLEEHLGHLVETVNLLLSRTSALEPMETRIQYVFISHVDEDFGVVKELADGLEAAGYATWYYERDSLPGISHSVQTREAIEQSNAVFLVISPHSISRPRHVRIEVFRAVQSDKPFLPLLLECSYAEFTQAQPEWEDALAGTVAASIPSGAPSSILPRIVAALEKLGIQPGLRMLPQGR